MHFKLPIAFYSWHFQTVTVAITMHDLKTLWSPESLTSKAPDKTTYEISDIPLFSYQTCPTNISCPVHILLCTYIFCFLPLIYQSVPSICCSNLNSQTPLVQQLHCNDVRQTDNMSLNSFFDHWGKKKEKDWTLYTLEHCNHAESTTEGKRVSSLPSGRRETQYSVYSVTMAFFFNYS